MCLYACVFMHVCSCTCVYARVSMHVCLCIHSLVACFLHEFFVLEFAQWDIFCGTAGDHIILRTCSGSGV